MRPLYPPKVFSISDRQEIDAKISAAIQDQHLEAVVALNADHFTYATGVVLPFAQQFPEPRTAVVFFRNVARKPVILCPVEWVQLCEQQGWGGSLVSYSAQDGSFARGLLAGLLKLLPVLGLESGQVGLDREGTAVLFVEELQKSLPDVEWVSFDLSWQELRMIKTTGEVRMIEEAARQADRALVSALNHSEGCVHDSVSYSMWEFTERIRVHVGEFGGSATGHVASMQGSDMQVYYRAPHGNIRVETPIRAEVTNHHYGYWADTARTLFVGPLCADFDQAYRDNIFLKNVAKASLRPGAVCSQVFEAVAKCAREHGIPLWTEAGIGHGVGVSEREAPYLAPQDNTVLQPGMVLTLAVYTYGPQGELICSKDTYLITPEGQRLLSWYRDWDSSIYQLVGNTARHG